MRTTTQNLSSTLLASMRLSRCRAIIPACILALMMCLAQSAGAQLIQNVVETGGDNDANDTVVAKWTGQTWSDHANNEPILGLTTGQPYTVGRFGNHSPAFVDRAHRYTNAEPTAIPSYLLGQEYIMSGNDNRDNGAYTLDVTVSSAVRVYMLIDNRLGDPAAGGDNDNATPPMFGLTRMQWILDEGWAAVQNGLNRTADASRPDEVGIDESADGTINQYYSIYAKIFPAGTFRLKQADNAGQNMYGVVVTPSSPLRVISCVAKCENNIIHVRYNRAVQLGRTDNYAYAQGFVNGVAYGADQSEVLVQTDVLEPNSAIELTILGVRDLGGSPLDPDPTICPLTYGFGSLTANFDGGVPAGTVAGGTAAPVVGAEGALHLTDRGVTGQQNFWTIPFAGTFNLDRLQARWKTLLGGLGQADGFSFNIGEAAVAGTPFTYSSGVNEEGATVGLSVTVDTFDNGDINPGGDTGLEVRWNGARLSYVPVAGGHVHGPAELMTGTFVDTSVDLTPSGFVTFRHGAFVTTAQIPGFTGIRVNQYEFAARTGGAAEDCWIDDVHINDFSMSGPTIGSQPSDLTAPENTTATFAVTGVNGIVPIAYQWFRNGVAIPGANGPSYSLSPVSADNGSKFSVRLANDCGTVTSQEATLTVVIAPIVLSTSSRGNCHAIYVTYNKVVQLDGTYSLVCSNGAPVVLLNQDFNAGDGGFTVETPIAFDGPWTYDGGTGRWSENGQEVENGHPNTTILTSPAMSVTQSGVVQLTFAHRHSFEGGNWDGGQVRVSVNGGAFTAVPASAFSQNGYNGSVANNSSSELKGQGAFVNNSPNFAAGTITSSCSLGVLQAGDSVRIQFFASSDSNTRGPNAPQWDLDSLQVASYAVSSINVAGAFYGESQNVVCLRLATDLVADVNTYRLLIRDVHGADGVVIQPNPTVSTFIHGGAEYPTFSILERRYDNIGGVNVSDLTGNAKFPNHPDLVLRNPTAFFETPTDVADNYGVQILGWAVAPATADYRFWVSSDDGSVLYIAEDAQPAHKHQIAKEPVWAGSREYTEAHPGTAPLNGDRGTPPANGSAPIHLLAGQVIYLEGLMKEGGGGDNFSVAATLEDPNAPANGSDPISIQYFQPRRLGPNGEIFTKVCDVFCLAGPSDESAYVGQSATFAFLPDGTPPWTIQWRKNGADIPGANGATYTTPPVTLADDGAVYTVALGNAFSSTTCSGRLHVLRNPLVVDASARCAADVISVLFNRPVKLDGTYGLDSGFVSGAAYGSSHNEVLVTVDPLTLGSVNILTIADVHSEDGFLMVPNPTTRAVGYGVGALCYNFNDGQLPAGTVASGTTPPYVGPEGALHITDQANGQANYWTIPLGGSQTFPQFSARWKMLIQGVGGADGISFNVGQNLGNTFLPEDGAANGLSVQVDTYNNGAGDAGIEIKWNGGRIGFLPVGPGGDGSGAPAELALGQFVDTSVEVTTSGAVTFKYATYVLNAQIPGYGGIVADQYVFAARTGGANENAWIDDLCIQSTPGAPSIVQQPADVLIQCSGSVTFTAIIDGTAPYNLQWMSNGVVVATINGAVSTVQSYTTPSLDSSADGAHYKLVIQNDCGTAMTREATVTRDRVAPVLLSAVSPGACVQGDGTKVILRFGEALEPASANNAANYTVNSGNISVTSARLVTGGGTGLTAMGGVPANGTYVELMLGSPLLRLNCNTVQASVRDNCLNSGGGTATIDLRTPIQATGPQNLIVIEAENFDFNRSPGTTNVGGAQGALNLNSWTFENSLPGFDGAGYMSALPNITSFGGNTPADAAFYASPRMDYCVEVPVSGTYYIWARGSSANDGGNNSFHMAVDGVSADDRSRRIGNAVQNWGGDAGNVNAFGWVNSAQAPPAAIDLAAGVHTISVMMREDGLRLDRFVLTTDAAFALATADAGPATSPRQTLPSDATPPSITCPADITTRGTGAGANCCAVVTYTATASDDCYLASVVCVPPSGSCLPAGQNTVICTATDGGGNIARCSFKVTVLCNEPPTAVISSEQLIDLGGEFEHPVLISCNWWNACLVADGWTSSDPEGGDLTYLWALEPDLMPFGAGPVVTNCLEVGVHTIILVVTDPTGLTGTTNLTIEVVTAPLAIEVLIEQITESHKSGYVLSRKIKRELTETLRVALGFAGREQLRETLKALDVFEKKVRAQVSTPYPELAEAWIRYSQLVSEGMEHCIKPPRKHKDEDPKDPDPKHSRK